jgi:integrase
MPLTDSAIRTAKPGEKARKLSDGGGLFLLVTPNGGKWWRLKFRFEGKEKLLSLGTYPEVGLREAREKREEMRRLLAAGVDVSENRKANKAARAEANANSFEVIAREWFAKYSPRWAASHSDKLIRRLERDIFPWMGKRPVADISAADVLDVLRRIEDRGAIETAHRAKQNCSQVFRYAIATRRAERDPTLDLQGALTPVIHKHFASVTEPKLVGELLRKLDGYKGHFVTRCALQLAPLLFVRPGELRKAEWADINLEVAEWRYLVTKTKTQHVVPLARQAVLLLKELQPLTGGGRYVFPNARTNTRPMSDAALSAALKRLGIANTEMSPHGFRAMARTILDEVLNVRPDYIEHQLAHAVRDPNGRAYNRTAHLAERRKMMQQWADYLDGLKTGADIIPFKQLA